MSRTIHVSKNTPHRNNVKKRDLIPIMQVTAIVIVAVLVLFLYTNGELAAKQKGGCSGCHPERDKGKIKGPTNPIPPDNPQPPSPNPPSNNQPDSGGGICGENMSCPENK